MGALPAATTKVNLDAATDDPKLARTELADILDKFNEMRTYLSGLFGTDGVASTARTNLGIDAAFPAGTEQLFGDNTLPTGWTQNVARNDEVVRIVSGVGNTSGGSASISGGSLNTTASALTIAQLASHDHDILVVTSTDSTDRIKKEPAGGPTTDVTQLKGSGSTHGHGGTYNIKFRDYVSATHD